MLILGFHVIVTIVTVVSVVIVVIVVIVVTVVTVVIFHYTKYKSIFLNTQYSHHNIRCSDVPATIYSGFFSFIN